MLEIERLSKLLEEEKFYIPNSMYIQWHLTELCNLRCKHCYQVTYKEANDLNHQEHLEILRQIKDLYDLWNEKQILAYKTVKTLTRVLNGSYEVPENYFNEAKNILQTYNKNFKKDPVRFNIGFTGGEPFVKKDFLSLLEVAADYYPGIQFSILTNGTVINKELANRVKNLGVTHVQVSIDGSESVHDSIRGKGSHSLAVRGIRYLLDAGIDTTMSFTANSDNYKEFSSVVELKEEKLVHQWFGQIEVIPVGTGKDLLTLSPDQTREYLI